LGRSHNGLGWTAQAEACGYSFRQARYATPTRHMVFCEYV
jgi:hypothetical protein